jgi:glycosyltransferase involved in cell wall biosynthesis
LRTDPHLVALLINMVPYHHVRWDAFAALGGVRCTVLELAGRDEFPVLEHVAGIASSYRRQTLFREASSRSVPTARISAAVGRALTELRPDVLCVNGYSSIPSLVALQWAADHSIPTAVCSESNRFDADRNPVKEWIKQRVIGFSSAGVAGGTPQADYLIELGLPKEAVFAGYDAVDNSHFATGAETARQRDDELRKELKLPTNYFIACSRFTEKKNIPRLIEAFALYQEQNSKNKKSWDLVIVGEGELRPLIEKAIQQFGVSHAVHLVGAKPYDVLPAYYALAGAFIHASTIEQWGLVVNEAMASGLPVLVSNRCGCAADLVQEGRNGFTFDPSNVADLAQLMVKISAFDFPLAAFGLMSRQIIAHWGPERFAFGMKAAVECALKAGAKRGSLFDRLLLRALIRR